ncbi:histidine phosphatase family protein [Deinococcus pimensis]|uniref:histidine phosphatase family protein n=1 Tax=Deinococcus pimensis TaxID=309888 RepID=UPI000488C323|nr:histidine phosphatase family protein [Deinococcus pimensis]
MSTLTLVRHGQATPFEQDTDRLSELGERQARALAQDLVERDVRFDEAYCGDLVRQLRTAEVVARTFREAGRPFPDLVVDERLNEYGAEGILRVLAPQLSLANPEFRELMRASEAARGGADRNRHFQRMLEALMDHWLGGEYELPEMESWADFAARTRGVLHEIVGRGGGGRRVVVFTSGGVIGRAVQLSLDAPDHAMLRLNWRVKNASRTEFTFGAGRLSLDAFNVTSHLETEGLESYR